MRRVLGKTAPYNTAIHAEVAATHAELVSLANTTITVAPTRGLTPQPDDASHRLIAKAFERRIAQAPELPGALASTAAI